MTKNSESDFFFSSTNIRIFFSATLGIRIFFLEKDARNMERISFSLFLLVLIISISTHLFIHLTTQKKKNRNYTKYL